MRRHLSGVSGGIFFLVDKPSRLAYSGGMNTPTDSLLPGYEPSEQDLVNRALAQPLEKKIARAIALLQHWEPEALKLDPRGYWVADSFGKDSDCIVELAKMAGVAHHCEHNLTTLDPPELIWYGKRTRPGTHINKPKIPMLKMLWSVPCGPPNRYSRWCCAKYKEGSKETKGIYARVIGIRIEESVNRAKLWSEFVQRRENDGFYICPVAYWTEADVWAFHELRGLDHCQLYDEKDQDTGKRVFHRLGCIGCPYGNRERDFIRWPKYKLMWQRSFQKLFEKWQGVPNRYGRPRSFEQNKTWQGFWAWWMEEKCDGPACQGAELFSTHELGDENANDE
jgi:phosphoadenosine phosphosulfate reductase